VLGTLRPSALAVKVDGQLDFGCPLDRQVRWFLTLKNAARVNTCLPVRVPDIPAVAHQSTGHGELSHCMHGWHRVIECQGCKLFGAAIKECVRANYEPTNLQLGQFCKHRFEFRFSARIQEMKLQPESTRRSLKAFRNDVKVDAIARIDEHRKTFGLRDQFAQQFQTLRSDVRVQRSYASDIALWPIGSTPVSKTIGIVSVAAFAASAAIPLPGTAITVTLRWTRSAASAGSWSF
jgi:hypothetical protein